MGSSLRRRTIAVSCIAMTTTSTTLLLLANLAVDNSADQPPLNLPSKNNIHDRITDGAGMDQLNVYVIEEHHEGKRRIAYY